jgi:hypothetical protein
VANPSPLSVWAQQQAAPPPPDATSVWAGMDPQAVRTQEALAPAPVKSIMVPQQQPNVTMAAPVAKAPSPQEKQIQADEGRLEKIRWQQQNPWGTPENHPGKLGKIAHVFSTIGNIAGDVFAPATMANIPGTQLNREVEGNQLARRINTESNSESENEYRGAETGKTEEETAEMPGKTASEEGLQGAEAAKANEETAEMPATQQSEISERNAHAQSLLHPKQTPQEETYADLIARGYTPEQALEKTKEHPPNISVNTGEKNLWSVPQPDGSHKVVSLQPGMTIPQGAVSLSGQSTENSKEGAADAPTVSALKFANDYLQSGAFTGPSDEALQDQFFQMAKPSTGFRMNQAQINQLHEMASWMDSWRGRAYHAINGTWFAPHQREQIVQTMNDLANSKGIAPATQGGAVRGGNQTETRSYNGATYAKGADGQWHKQ